MKTPSVRSMDWSREHEPELSVEEPPRLDQAGEVLARLDRAEPEDGGTAEVGRRAFCTEAVREPRRRVDDPLLLDAEGRRQVGRGRDQEGGPLPRHENTRSDEESEPAEIHPAEDVLERQAHHPLLQHLQQALVVGPARREESRLVLGEDASGGA